MSPRDIYGRPEQKKLLSHYYLHQTKFPIIPLHTLSELRLSELKLLPYYLLWVVKGNLCHPGTLWLSEDVFMHILLLNQEIMRDLSMNCSNTFGDHKKVCDIKIQSILCLF